MKKIKEAEWVSSLPENIANSIELHVSENAVLAIKHYRNDLTLCLDPIGGKLSFSISSGEWNPPVSSKTFEISEIVPMFDDEKEREIIVNGLLELIENIKTKFYI